MPPVQKPVAVTGADFTLVVWIVAGLCFLSLAIILVLAILASDPLSRAQEVALETTKYAFTTTLGAIVGLLAGRASQPTYHGDLPGRPRK